MWRTVCSWDNSIRNVFNKAKRVCHSKHTLLL